MVVTSLMITAISTDEGPAVTDCTTQPKTLVLLAWRASLDGDARVVVERPACVFKVIG